MGNPDSLLAYLEGLSDDEVMRFKADIHDRLPVLFEDCRARAKVGDLAPAHRGSLAVDLMAAHPRLEQECREFVARVTTLTNSPVDYALITVYLLEQEVLRSGKRTNLGYLLRLLSSMYPGRKPYTRKDEKTA